jgi:hypothetical protein
MKRRERRGVERRGEKKGGEGRRGEGRGGEGYEERRDFKRTGGA